MNDKPITVAQIIGKWVGGGVEAVVMNYYRNIDKSKIQFDFICDDDSSNIPYEEIEKLGGKVILIPPYQKVFKYRKEVVKVLKENEYKIVHSHINTLSVFSLSAAKKAGVPVRIAHSHSTTNPKEWKKNLLKLVLRPLNRIYANRYMSCTNHAGKWMFGKKNLENNKIFVLKNAIDINKYKYNESIRNSKRNELGISKDTIVLGHVGRFVEQKNHRFIIDIFNGLKKENINYKLLLIGQGPLENEIKQKVNDLGLNDSVMFLGQRNDVNDLYQAMDIFIFPSLYEGLGMVAVEAQVSGCKCFVSTEVPIDAKISDDIIFLDNNLEHWINEIKKCNIDNRKDNKEKAIEYGYDIIKEVRVLEDKYLSEMNNL